MTTAEAKLRTDHKRILDVLELARFPITCDEIANRVWMAFRVKMSANNVATRMSDRPMKPFVLGVFPEGKRYKVWRIVKN